MDVCVWGVCVCTHRLQGAGVCAGGVHRWVCLGVCVCTRRLQGACVDVCVCGVCVCTRRLQGACVCLGVCVCVHAGCRGPVAGQWRTDRAV